MFICWITALFLPDGEGVAYRLQLISGSYCSENDLPGRFEHFFNKFF
jgi:hypothetical protein